MTEKEIRRLSRADLLELLIDQTREMNELRARLEAAERELADRRIRLAQAGSIAEAALKLNGVFEAAQAACNQYLENIRLQGGELLAQGQLGFEPDVQPAGAGGEEA